MTKKKTIILVAVLMATFIVSLIWHLPVNVLVKQAQPVLDQKFANLKLEDSSGNVWQGSTNLQWQPHDSPTTVDAGQLSWAQSPLDLLGGAVSPKLTWITQFGQWQGTISKPLTAELTEIETDSLQVNLQQLQSWLSAFFRSPFLVKGDVFSNQLQAVWSAQQLLTDIDAKVFVKQLNVMGVELPELEIKVSMPDKSSQIVKWQLQGQAQSYHLQGEGEFVANPSSPQFANVQGILRVNADSSEQMPDFANLFPQLSATQAALPIKTNLKRFYQFQ